MFAWIEDNRIRDICRGDPSQHFHPEVAKHYTTPVPHHAANGDGWVNGELVKPLPPEPTIEPAVVESEPPADGGVAVESTTPPAE